MTTATFWKLLFERFFVSDLRRSSVSFQKIYLRSDTSKFFDFPFEGKGFLRPQQRLPRMALRRNQERFLIRLGERQERFLKTNLHFNQLGTIPSDGSKEIIEKIVQLQSRDRQTWIENIDRFVVRPS